MLSLCSAVHHDINFSSFKACIQCFLELKCLIINHCETKFCSIIRSNLLNDNVKNLLGLLLRLHKDLFLFYNASFYRIDIIENVVYLCTVSATAHYWLCADRAGFVLNFCDGWICLHVGIKTINLKNMATIDLYEARLFFFFISKHNSESSVLRVTSST